MSQELALCHRLAKGDVQRHRGTIALHHELPGFTDFGTRTPLLSFGICHCDTAQACDLVANLKPARFAQNLQEYRESVSINAVGCRISYDWDMLIQLLQP